VRSTAVSSPALPIHCCDDVTCSGAVGGITRIAHVPPPRNHSTYTSDIAYQGTAQCGNESTSLQLGARTAVSAAGGTEAMEMYASSHSLIIAGIHNTASGLQHLSPPLPDPSRTFRCCSIAAVGSIWAGGVATQHEATLGVADVSAMMTSNGCRMHKRQRVTECCKQDIR
jgi:hypothetical protein